LKISTVSYFVAMGKLKLILNRAFGERAQLMILLEARDPFEKLAFSHVGTHVAVVSNNVTFWTIQPEEPSNDVSSSTLLM